MKKKISKLFLNLARKKVLQIGFLSLFIFLAFFNFTLAQSGMTCGPIIAGIASANPCTTGDADFCQIQAICTQWDNESNVGFCYFENLTSVLYCVSTNNWEGDDLEVRFGSDPVESICIDSPSAEPCTVPITDGEEWTWSGPRVINDIVNPGINLEINAYVCDNTGGTCTAAWKSETWGQAIVNYTYQQCCPDGYTYDDTDGTPKCLSPAGSGCVESGGECCLNPQVCPMGQRITGKTGCTHPEKCCNPGQCINSEGNDCIVNGGGVCCDLSTSECNLPAAGIGCGPGTECCLDGFCVYNSPSNPTDPTQDPTWTPVSWTPLVKIPGMPTGAAPLGGYIVALYNFLLGAIGIIAMIMLVYGGFRYMTSAGNPTAMGDAKDIFYSAIIGLALALVSWMIISVINPELLFTQDAKLAPVGSPAYSTNLPANSCAYNSHGGYEKSKSTGYCNCIGDTDATGDTDCEGAIENYTGTCNEFCKNSICLTIPECCLSPDLRVGTDINDVSHKSITAYVDQTIYFDPRTHSVNCLDTSSNGIIKYKLDDPSEDWALLTWGDYVCINEDVLSLDLCGLGGFFSGIGLNFLLPPGLNFIIPGHFCGVGDPIQHSYSTAKDVEVELIITSGESSGCIESRPGLDKVKIHIIN